MSFQDSRYGSFVSARNPRTGDAVPVPSRRVPVFKVSKMLKDKVALS